MSYESLDICAWVRRMRIMMRRRRMRRRKTMTTDGRLRRTPESLRNSSASMKSSNQIPAGVRQMLVISIACD